jgi:hypothetical protein
MPPFGRDANGELLQFALPGARVRHNIQRRHISVEILRNQSRWSHIFAITLALLTTLVLGFCFAMRIPQLTFKNFRDVPLVRWREYLPFFGGSGVAHY